MIDFSKVKRNKLDHLLYCITSEEHSNGRSNIEIVEDMLKAGVKLIQYRDKDKDLLQKYNECKTIRGLTSDYGATFIVNDHVDLAILVGADGVHVGQDDLPVPKVRELVGHQMIIGVSTHSPKQAEDAVKDGADYIGVGPIYKTYTKKNVCDPVGLEYLEYVAKNIDMPFVAIGGIKEHNIQDVIHRGAKCVSIVTDIVESEDIEKKVLSLMNILKGNVKS